MTRRTPDQWTPEESDIIFKMVVAAYNIEEANAAIQSGVKNENAGRNPMTGRTAMGRGLDNWVERRAIATGDLTTHTHALKRLRRRMGVEQ